MICEQKILQRFNLDNHIAAMDMYNNINEYDYQKIKNAFDCTIQNLNTITNYVQTEKDHLIGIYFNIKFLEEVNCGNFRIEQKKQLKNILNNSIIVFNAEKFSKPYDWLPKAIKELKLQIELLELKVNTLIEDPIRN